MIIYLLLTLLTYIVSIVFAVFPTVTELPWGVDSTLVDGVASYKLIMGVIPPLGLMLDLTIIYITFRLSIIVLRFFLGSRTPSHV